MGNVKRFAVLALLLPGASPPAPGRDDAVDFARDVLPILTRACFDCHGPDKQKGGLRLDRREAALKGGNSGKIILPGRPEKSDLYRRIALPKGDEDAMPARGEPLARTEIAAIREWIRQGAAWPANAALSRHWAYVKPVLPAQPAVRDGRWPRNGIDFFVLARLEREALAPSPEADRAALLRRVALDLAGLPPSPAETDAFLADRSDEAYSRAVDRLLASPRFGERWARPWLDLARYADSHGFQRDDLREIWAYRDWVIRALNDDMPFDRFTIEQLAGDLLPNATEEQRIATGFNRCAPTNVEAGSEPEETRVNQVIDRVNTTAAVWLGATLECAQCHDHKYDPFTQRDYYGLFAFFNGTAIEADRTNPKVPGSIRFLGPAMSLREAGRGEERARLAGEIARLDEALASRRRALDAEPAAWEARIAAAIGSAAQTHVLRIEDFDSEAGAPHRVLEDGSILLVDDAPERDVYVATVRTKLAGITGFRLEALTDPSLPGQGPGRGDEKRPNFVLNSFEVREGGRAVRLKNARASFSQKNFDVAGAVDDDPKTAWAINPKFHEPHWAEFETDRPIGSPEGLTLTFRLVQNYGAARTLGRLRLSALTGTPGAKALPAEVAEALRAPADRRVPAQARRLSDFRLEQDTAAAKLRDQRADAERRLQAIKPPTTLVMEELEKSRATAVFKRGNYADPGAAVEPGTPQALHPSPPGTRNRLALARWLVDRENPLVARVTVNRLWAEIFGRGIVGTVEDFGAKGEPPSHPDLLDWLAVEFMEGGWSLKKIIRTIVLSATYRQSSRMTPELLARDDQNRLLARGPRFRLDAEAIRDNALAAAGLLSLKQGGPPVRPPQPAGVWTKIGGAAVEYVVSPGEDRYRRGIYVVWKRAAPYPSFAAFDATARLACTVKRSRSNTPLQALALLNDPVYVEAAMALARRVLEEKKDGVDARVRHAFRLCLVREPGEAEVRVLRKLHDAQLAAGREDGAAVRELLAEFPAPAGASPEEFAAWYAVAAALLNLDEMITKG